MNKEVQTLVTFIREKGFNVEVTKMYGVYMIDFDHTGIQIRELKKIIDSLPLNSLITSSSNRSIRINTRIPIK